MLRSFLGPSVVHSTSLAAVELNLMVACTYCSCTCTVVSTARIHSYIHVYVRYMYTVISDVVCGIHCHIEYLWIFVSHTIILVQLLSHSE